MFLPILIIIFILSLLSDVYLWQSVARLYPSPWCYIHWLAPTLLWTCVLYIAAGGYTAKAFTLVFYLVLLACIPRWIHALLVLVHLPHTGLLMRSILIVTVLVGIIYGWKHLVVRKIEIPCANLPASFRNYRIVHLSDLHIGTYASAPHMVDRIVEQVNAQQPDLIVFTGDIVNLSSNELPCFLPALSHMQARDGIVSILGNHDYCTYGPIDSLRPPRAQTQELIEMQRDMGWKVLLNEHIIIHHDTDSIAIVGIENGGRPPFPQRADLPKAMDGLNNKVFKLLLSHDPSFWRQNVTGKTDISLTLSGHTHAMQLRIGNFSPSAFIYDEWGGLYSQNGQHLYVSTGTGSNIPFRLGAWPEIDVITLTREDVR